jgi:uncharacterized protein involved in exopolysaccharide biosynthesis
VAAFVTPAEPPAPESRDYNLSLLGLLVVWLSHWRALVTLPLIAAVVALGVSFLVRPQYHARGQFVPESRSTAGLGANLSGLASQLGVSVAGGEPTQSPQFYADLVKTRPVLTAVLLRRYPQDTAVGEMGSSKTLLDWLVSVDHDERRRIERGIRRLSDRTAVDVDRRTNVVTLGVEMPSPSLAAAVVTQYLDYLNEFNLRYRQSQARARREFDERQVGEAEKTLTALEDTLRNFYERNRQWESSPKLRFEENRLRRRVDVQQELFLSLRRELESARIAEVNDTPVLTVIEPPVAPARKTSPQRLQWTWLGFVLSTLGVLIGLVLYESRFHWRAVDPVAYDWLLRRLRPSRPRQR